MSKHEHEHEHNHEHEHSHEHEHCCCGCEHGCEEEEFDLKKSLIRAAAGIIALAGAILTDGYISIALYITAYVIFGYDVVINAFKSIIRGKALDEHFLMAFATICAFCLGEFTEAVSVMLFYQIGEFLQDSIVDRSRRSIKNLMEMNIEKAYVLIDGSITEKAPEEVEIGDTVVVKPGEKIPVDGTVTKGSSSLDMKALTGESLPVEINEGDGVLSGSVNNSNVIYIKADKKYSDSTVSRIMELIENASSKKSKTENFVTKFARVYTPIVVALAIVIAIVPALLGYDLKAWVYRALIFLVASCPCALVLSIPLTFFAGIGTMSRRGVLVKGSSYIEALSRTDAVVMDKTGTVTKGSFEVTEYENDEALRYAAAVERFSTHPLAQAVVNYCGEDIPDAEQVENIAGYGIKGICGGRTILAGSERLMSENGISVPAGKSIYVACDGEYIGYINAEDTIKEDSKEAIAELKALGIKNIAMLTGDKREIAEKTGRAAGIDAVYAELLPQDKIEKTKELYSKGCKTICAVGDGINDAPLLAGADVGIAMGGIGSDAAIEAADVVIMKDSLIKLPAALRLARKTMAICSQNVFIVIALKVLVLIITVLGYGNMWIAVFADVGVALIAVLNSIRITRVK